MKEVSIVTNSAGEEIDFEASVNFMDDELREKIHRELSTTTDQEFFDAYSNAHREKFHTEWMLNVPNPTW